MKQARMQEFVYNAAGQEAGVRVSDVKGIARAGWQCNYYNSQGQLTSQTWPANPTARTVTYTYGVGGNPLVSSVSDSSGTITDTVDLEGRLTSYTDALGQTTTSTYNQAGQLTQTSSAVTGTITSAYDPNSGLPTEFYDGYAPIATATYYPSTSADDADLLDTVTYGNGIKAQYSYNAYGTESGVSYVNGSGTSIASENVWYTLAGREQDDGFDGNQVSNPNGSGPDFTYDHAGRLVQAFVPGEEISYSYGTSGSALNCPDPSAGLDTNVTGVTTTPTGGSSSTVSYCYNSSDQLTGIGNGSATTSTSYSYDDEGDQQKDGANTYTWDSSGRVATIKSASSKEKYTYDALNRVIQKVVGKTTDEYTYCGFTASPCGTLSGSGAPVSGYVSLLGGVVLTVIAGSSSSDTWSLPDIHGDFLMTTSSTGVASGLDNYTPYGALTPSSAGALANSGNAGSTLGAFGSSTKVTDTDATDPVVVLGARLYNPVEGRFASVDPIEGGCANPYVYVFGDPLNHADLSGQGGCGGSQSPVSGSCSLGWNPSCEITLSSSLVQKLSYYADKFDLATAIVALACAFISAGICSVVSVPLAAAIIAAVSIVTYFIDQASVLGDDLELNLSLWDGLRTYDVTPPRPC
jgi:RHS repeat-associated protein